MNLFWSKRFKLLPQSSSIQLGLSFFTILIFIRFDQIHSATLVITNSKTTTSTHASPIGIHRHHNHRDNHNHNHHSTRKNNEVNLELSEKANQGNYSFRIFKS